MIVAMPRSTNERLVPELTVPPQGGDAHALIFRVETAQLPPCPRVLASPRITLAALIGERGTSGTSFDCSDRLVQFGQAVWNSASGSQY